MKGRRDVWFAEVGGVQPTVVLDRGRLLRGNVIDGPAIIAEPDASTLDPGWTATVDEHANPCSAHRRAEASLKTRDFHGPDTPVKLGLAPR